jgi:hypothetical protein
MSAHEVLADALVAALHAYAPLGVGLNGVFDAPPARAVRPYALVDEAVLTDWSAKDWTGREGRLSVVLFDEGERTARLRGLMDQVVEAVAGVPRALGEGWRVASLVFVRSRVVKDGERRWAGVVEFRVRVLRVS